MDYLIIDLSNESNNNNEQNNETAAQHSGQASLEEVDLV